MKICLDFIWWGERARVPAQSTNETLSAALADAIRILELGFDGMPRSADIVVLTSTDFHQGGVQLHLNSSFPLGLKASK